MSSIYLDPCNHSNSKGDCFVGVKISVDENVDNKKYTLKACFPLGYNYTEEDQRALSKEVFSLLKLIKKYGKGSDNEKEITGNDISKIPFYEYITVIEDFMRFGYHTERESKYKHAMMGKINWKRTIAQVKPLVQKNSPIYSHFVVRINEKRNDKLISLVHEWCVYEAFLRFGWLHTSFIPRKPMLTITDKNKRYYISIIRESLKTTFNDRLKRLFNAMIAILSDEQKVGDSKRSYTFGTENFEKIWEKIIDESYGTYGVIYEALKTLERDKYKSPAVWIYTDYSWEKASKLEPDTIMVLPDKDSKDSSGTSIFVLDAKYYSTDKNGTLHLPSASDINKQIRYGKYVAEIHKNPYTYNAFLLPYDFEKLEGIKPGVFKDDCLSQPEEGKYYYIGYAMMISPENPPDSEKKEYKPKNKGEKYEYVLGILIDTRWLMENVGNTDKFILANFIKDKCNLHPKLECDKGVKPTVC